MKRILLVDEDTQLLAGVRQALQTEPAQWEVALLESGAQAWRLFSESPFDAVVAGLTLPGMAGPELLKRISRKHPQTIRIAISRRSEAEAIQRFAATAHQLLPKPCTPELIRETLTRAFALNEVLQHEKLRRLVARLPALPSVPMLLQEIMRELRKEEPSVNKLGELIAQDPGICTKLLHLINSAFFGFSQLISHPTEAVLCLGIEMTKNIVIALQLFSIFDGAKLKPSDLNQVWQHSWAVGRLARCLAETENWPFRDQALIGGLIHDVGKLILLAGIPDRYLVITDYARQRRLPAHLSEQEFLGATHAEIGAYLAGLWGLPDPIVEAVALHHRPEASPIKGISLVTLLHIANALEHERLAAVGVPPRLNLDYLETMGLRDRLPAWQELSRRQAFQKPA